MTLGIDMIENIRILLAITPGKSKGKENKNYSTNRNS
jgi:hypothetical protein